VAKFDQSVKNCADDSFPYLERKFAAASLSAASGEARPSVAI
jgi:hypothetical protein